MAALGLGLAALGRPGYMTVGHSSDVADPSVTAMQKRAHAVLDAAYALGIRHIDVARSYGKGEHFLRDWLDDKAMRGSTKDLFISSKWGYRYTAQWQASTEVHEVKDLSAQHLNTQWHESRVVLGPWLKLYQVHSATLESNVLDDAAVLNALEQLRTTGLEVGLTVTGPRQAETIRKALTRKVFTWVQATWNLLERSATDALAEAHAQGLKVVVKEGVANGRLSTRGDVTAFLALAHERGVSPDALALGAALAQPWATTVLSGAATVEQLTSNARAKATPLDARLDALQETPEHYWRKRSALRWS